MIPGKYTKFPKSAVFGGDDDRPRAIMMRNAPDEILRQYASPPSVQLDPPPEAPQEPPAAAPADG
jgi:hypothetical protein